MRALLIFTYSFDLQYVNINAPRIAGNSLFEIERYKTRVKMSEEVTY